MRAHDSPYCSEEVEGLLSGASTGAPLPLEEDTLRTSRRKLNCCSPALLTTFGGGFGLLLATQLFRAQWQGWSRWTHARVDSAQITYDATQTKQNCHIETFLESRRLRQASRQTSNLHPWKSLIIAASAADQEDVVADVYFLRHGQNPMNIWWTEHQREPPKDYRHDHADNSLTRLGVQQAVLVQDILSHKLELDKVPAQRVQLAASLNARAFDTTVIGAAQLWRAWREAGARFELHAVPALMEIEITFNSKRRAGLSDDDPVRWEDSVLAGNLSELAQADGARRFFYQTADDRAKSVNETSKPVQVEACYRRVLSAECKDSERQLDHLAAYLSQRARSGKSHILLGTHSKLIKCMMRKYSTKPSVPTDGKSYALTDKVIPNAAVLHVRLRHAHGKTLTLEPRFLYENKIESGLVPSPDLA